MRRLFTVVSLGLLSLALLVSPARACINDRDTKTSEREFKSQYEESPGTESLTPGSPPSSSSDYLISLGVGGAGGLLLIGALGLTAFRSGSRR
jgi:hypothetical protein